MKIYQRHEIESNYIDIDNECTIVLYDSKSVVHYINLNCELCLRALEEIKVVKKTTRT